MGCRECDRCGWLGNAGTCPRCGATTSWDEQGSDTDTDDWALDHDFDDDADEGEHVRDCRKHLLRAG